MTNSCYLIVEENLTDLSLDPDRSLMSGITLSVNHSHVVTNDVHLKLQLSDVTNSISLFRIVPRVLHRSTLPFKKTPNSYSLKCTSLFCNRTVSRHSLQEI